MKQQAKLTVARGRARPRSCLRGTTQACHAPLPAYASDGHPPWPAQRGSAQQPGAARRLLRVAARQAWVQQWQAGQAFLREQEPQRRLEWRPARVQAPQSPRAAYADADVLAMSVRARERSVRKLRQRAVKPMWPRRQFQQHRQSYAKQSAQAGAGPLRGPPRQEEKEREKRETAPLAASSAPISRPADWHAWARDWVLRISSLQVREMTRVLAPHRERPPQLASPKSMARGLALRPPQRPVPTVAAAQQQHPPAH